MREEQLVTAHRLAAFSDAVTRHFALETDAKEIAATIREVLAS